MFKYLIVDIVMLLLVQCNNSKQTCKIEPDSIPFVSSNIIPESGVYQDYESSGENHRINPEKTNNNIDTDTFFKKESVPYISNIKNTSVENRSNKPVKPVRKYQNKNKGKEEDDYKWISDSPKTRQEAYEWAYKAYKAALSEQEPLSGSYINRALELWENGSLWTEKAKRAMDSGLYEKAIMYCDASIRRNDHWNPDDKRMSQVYKYQASEFLYNKYPSKFTNRAAVKAFKDIKGDSR